MDDNFPQQSLRVPPSFSPVCQPGPGRTHLLSAFLPPEPSRSGRPPTPPPPTHPSVFLLSFLREKKNLGGRRIKAGAGRTGFVPQSRICRRFTYEELQSTSDSFEGPTHTHTHNPKEREMTKHLGGRMWLSQLTDSQKQKSSPGGI